MATAVNEKTFDEVLKNNELVLIDFWADWCMPCRMLAPVLEELSKELEGKVFIGKVNVDENRRLASKFHIMSIPTMLVFVRGRQVDMVVGAAPKAEIKKTLEKYMKK